MARNSVSDYSQTASENTDVQSINIAEQCPASNINNAIRQLMAHLADVFQGATTATQIKALDLWAGAATIQNLTLGSGTATYTPVGPSRQIIAGPGMSGGGDLSADRTLALNVNNLTATATILETDSFPFHSTGSATGTYRALKSALAATESQAGFVRLATEAETVALTAANLAVSPLHLGKVGLQSKPYIIPAGSGSSVSVTDLPKSRAFLIFCRDLSHNSGNNQTLEMEASDDNGSAWSSPQQIGSAVSSAAIRSLQIFVAQSEDTNSKQLFSIGMNANSDGNSRLISSGSLSSVTGLINALRFSWSGGSFDGTGPNPNIYVYCIV